MEYLELLINMPLFSKARPRVTQRGVFMPKAYRDNQKEMRRQLEAQWGDRPALEGPLRLEIELYGEGRGDIDNMIGAFFDTANKLLWVDDRVSIITSVNVQWTKAQKVNSKWVIRIYTDVGQQTLL